MEHICKLKTLNEGVEPEDLMDADRSECKRIRVLNYVLAPGMLKRYLNLVRWENKIQQDIRQMKIKNWITCVQDRGKWKEVVE
jgi:hypothetical protein